jgi:hypothetical protein
MSESEKQKLIRQYAAGEITWHALRGRGFGNYVEVLAGLGELGLRRPVAARAAEGVPTGDFDLVFFGAAHRALSGEGEGLGDAERRCARVPDRTKYGAFDASLRCGEQRPRRLAAPLQDHRRRLRLGALAILSSPVSRSVRLCRAIGAP